MKALIEQDLNAISPPPLRPHVLRFVFIGLPILIVYYTLVVLAVLAAIQGTVVLIIEALQ